MNGSVAIVIESLGAGGAQHVASTLANAWADAGVAVTMITLQDRKHDFFRVDKGVNRIVIGGAGVSPNSIKATIANIQRIWKLRKALRDSKATIALSFIGSTNVLTILAAVGLGLYVVIAERNDPDRQSLGRIWEIFRRLFYRFANLVVVNSRSVMNGMQSYVPRARLVWLPNPLRTRAQRQFVDGLPDKCSFLAVGRLYPQKAYDVLLLAFAEVVRSLPDARLVILGEGPLRRALECQIAQLNLTGQVQLPGKVADPFCWYRAAQVFVHPARFEGLPNAVLEAMSEALPVIVSDAQTGLEGIVVHRQTGFIVPVESWKELAKAMLYLAGNPDIGKKIGQAAQRAVVEFQAEHAIAAWTKNIFGNA
jgi:GalNAc-alpha-(1->4)-GalNAc-alpha-(1->3)-diNAcBac-PP-undecaprenol alpha-1,4-N-acetyl-D-galactosaminyltransferase